MRRLNHAVALLALVAGIAGCSESRRPEKVLRLATANPAGVEHDFGLRFFAARVAQLSHGRLQIAFDDRWGSDGDAHEDRLIRALADGAADLGVVHTRSLASAGAGVMDALDAPMLIDRYSLEAAVIASPLASRLLAGTRAAGVEGLALLAGRLAHPVGTRGPILSAAAAYHRNFYVRGTALHAGHHPVTQQAAVALGAFVWPLDMRLITVAYVAGARAIEVPGLYEDDLDSLFFDRYGAQCAPPNRACRTMGPWITVNVTLWPRMSAIVANPAALERLTPRERGWLRAAASAAARYSTSVGRTDQSILDELCAAGVRAARAPRSGVFSLERRWRPFYHRLQGRPLIRAIERLRSTARPDPPLRIPAHCGRLALHQGPARGVRSTLPNGTYRVRISAGDLRVAGANAADDQPGVDTLTLDNGRWRLVVREPGGGVESGTYAGTLLRTAWESNGPDGRDEAYMSITAGPGGALSFRVARADLLPHLRAIYASHPWRRIEP